MGFVRIFWKNDVQEAYLPKMSILGQIVSEIVAQLCLENSIQTLLNLKGFVWSFIYIGIGCDLMDPVICFLLEHVAPGWVRGVLTSLVCT